MNNNNLKNIVSIRGLIFAGLLLAISSSVILGQVKPSENAGLQTVRSLDNTDYEPCQKAIKSFRAASVLVIGVEIEPDSVYEKIWLTNWLIYIGKTPAYKTPFAEGLGFMDAVNAIKDSLANGGTSLPWQVFNDVYGRPVTKAERDFYEPKFKAKKVTYTTILNSEKSNLNKNPTEREAMINRAFMKAKKKAATTDEIKYWKPRTDIFITIVKVLENK
jgi:hypothetical protein